MNLGNVHKLLAEDPMGRTPGPDPLRRLPPSPPPPCRVLAAKCRTMGAEGALRKFWLT